jgi:hypothetical protein
VQEVHEGILVLGLDRIAPALPFIEAAEEGGDVLESCAFELERRTGA